MRIPARALLVAIGVIAVAFAAPKPALPQLWAAGPSSSPATPTPTPTATPTPPPLGQIQHIVVIVQENRTVDNLFHGYPDGASFPGTMDTVSQDPVTLTTLHGIHMTDPCGISHAHSNFATEYNNGAMNGFKNQGGGDCPQPDGAFAFVFQDELTEYWGYAQQYAAFDHLLFDNGGPSYPAHQYLFRGQAGGIKTIGGIDTSNPWSISENSSPGGNGTSCNADHGTLTKDLNLTSSFPGSNGQVLPPCIHTNNIIDEAQTAGLSWVYYSEKNTGLWSGPMSEPDLGCVSGGPAPSPTCVPVSNIVNCSPQALIDMLALKPHGNHVLPNLTYIMPNGQWSDHPGDPDTDTDGEDWVSWLINSIGTSQYWNTTAIIVLWDDWGGWYDHYNPGGTPGLGITNCPLAVAGFVTPANCGFRGPLILVSPFSKAGYVGGANGIMYGSLNRFIEAEFNLPSLNASDAWTTESLTDGVDLTQNPIPYRTMSPITPSSRYTSQSCNSNQNVGPDLRGDG